VRVDVVGKTLVEYIHGKKKRYVWAAPVNSCPFTCSLAIRKVEYRIIGWGPRKICAQIHGCVKRDLGCSFASKGRSERRWSCHHLVGAWVSAVSVSTKPHPAWCTRGYVEARQRVCI
jgi:hypothetical protein